MYFRIKILCYIEIYFYCIKRVLKIQTFGIFSAGDTIYYSDSKKKLEKNTRFWAAQLDFCLKNNAISLIEDQ